jgi:hypothetical protein
MGVDEEGGEQTLPVRTEKGKKYKLKAIVFAGKLGDVDGVGLTGGVYQDFHMGVRGDASMRHPPARTIAS